MQGNKVERVVIPDMIVDIRAALEEIKSKTDVVEEGISELKRQNGDNGSL